MVGTEGAAEPGCVSKLLAEDMIVAAASERHEVFRKKVGRKGLSAHPWALQPPGLAGPCLRPQAPAPGGHLPCRQLRLAGRPAAHRPAAGLGVGELRSSTDLRPWSGNRDRHAFQRCHGLGRTEAQASADGGPVMTAGARSPCRPRERDAPGTAPSAPAQPPADACVGTAAKRTPSAPSAVFPRTVRSLMKRNCWRASSG